MKKHTKKSKLIFSAIILVAVVVVICIFTATPKEALIDDVAYINQLDEGFPTGCESVSTVMALNYIGVDISVDDFVDKYLPKSDSTYEFDPYREFGGDPRSKKGGVGCYYTAIETAVNNLIEDQNLDIKVTALKDVTLEKLCSKYVAKGIPVVMWATAGMAKTYETKVILKNGQLTSWRSPLHCLLLVGYDEDNCIFHDPLTKSYQSYSKETVRVAYFEMLKQAIVVEKK